MASRQHFSPVALLAWLIVCLVALSACAPAAQAPTVAPTPAAEKPAAEKPAAEKPAAAPTQAPAAVPTAPPKPAATAAPAAQPVPLTMAVLSNILYSPYYVGVEKGIFLKHGIDLKLKIFNAAADVIKALQAGDAQLGVGAWAGIAPAKVQGVDIKVFYLIVSDPADLNYDQFNGIAVRPGVKVDKVEDLAGLKIATSAGGGTDTFLRAHLANAKVPLDKVTFLNVGFPNMLASLQSGADAAAAPEPYLGQIEEKLPGSKVLLHGGNVSNARILTITMADWLNKNPELAEKLWAGSAESSQYARQHAEDTAVAASHFLTGIDQPVLRKALNYVMFDPRLTPKIEEAFAAESKQLLEQKKMPSEPKVSDLLVTSLMQSLPKKYAQFFNDLKPIADGSY